jgi:hypothetical protein
VSPNETSLLPRVSRYRFTEVSGNGIARTLRIEGEDRNTVFVVPTPTGLLVRYRDDQEGWYYRRYGFFDYYTLAHDVASGLVLSWTPPEGRSGWPGVRRWVRNRTGRAIGKRLHAFYKRCLDAADPTVLALQRTVFATTFSTLELVLREELYREKYLVKDVEQHRAAAAALANLDMLRYLNRRNAFLDAKEKLLTSREHEALKTLANCLEIQLSVDVVQGERCQQDHLSVDVALEMMEDWRGLFSPTGESYRSLDRTLMNLPGGVPARLLVYLSQVYLEMPVLSRSELTVLTLYEGMQLHRESPRRNARVFREAREDRIARAGWLVADHTRNPLSTRRAKDLQFLVGFLRDYPDEHRGNIVGLAEKSIRWHRRERGREIERTLNKLGNMPTQVPPIPLPEEPNIRFLSDVEEVCEEGLKMNNCVASYARGAVQGLCYLFHVSHADEEATVEVDRAGRVAQAAGPANGRNAASRWGERALRRWGRAFPEDHQHAPTVADIPDIREGLLEDIPF